MKRLRQFVLLLAFLSLAVLPLLAAFPSVATCTGSSRSTNALDDSVTLPASIASGDLIVVFHGSDFAATRTFPSPWLEIKDALCSTSVCNIGIGYLIAAGGETAVTVTKSVSERHSSLACRIPAASWHGTTPPEVSTGAAGSSTTPDPDTVTASWGSDDNLFFAVTVFDNSAAGGAITAYPTSYASNQFMSPDISSGARVAVATRNLAAASDDPGTFTMSPTDQWWAGTVVVRPAAGGGGAAQPPTQMMMGVGN